ncbi:MAG: DUF1343 domain-containing protein [Limnochordales bacterium]|nr:DUF1343 domain-containing protein [Limnochordales bacterium]
MLTLIATVFLFSFSSRLSLDRSPLRSRPAEAASPSPAAGPTGRSLALGIDILLTERIDLIAGKRVGLITNQTGRGRDGVHDADRLAADPRVKLVALFSPEHGIRGDEPPGAKVSSYIDPVLRIPVWSLYGQTLKPTPAMLANIDVLIFDIQDVGTRYYTYISTMAYAMQAAKEKGIRFIVLDRPNPIGGLKVEGPVLEDSYRSFVGIYPIPVRHGMTVGELALLFNEEFGIGADLEVVKMSGWQREMYWDATGLTWIKPSPNMVRLETALVYPGTCLLEGTNVSEGRGSPRPFEMIGAPWIDGDKLAQELNALSLPGVRFAPTAYVPTTSKYQGQRVEGVEIIVTDRQRFEAVRTGLWIIATLRKLYPRQFRFTTSGGKYYFDTLIGNGWMRPALEQSESPDELLERSRPRLEAFVQVRSRYLLYR